MSPRSVAAGRPDCGFALLIVLWTLVLLSLLVSTMTASGGLRARQAGEFRRNARLEALADGGVDRAVFHLLDPSSLPGGHWFADGSPHRSREGDVALTIRILNEAGKVNPNRAQPALLAALLQAVGADQRSALMLANNIVGWRFPGSIDPGYRAAGRDYLPPGALFESVSELRLVLGMTPPLLAALTPHLSVFTQGDPDPALADPVVRRALAASGSTQPANVVPGAAPPDETLVRIVVTAEDAAGHRFRRRAIVLTGQGGTGGEADRPFHVLAWDAPAA